MFGNNSNLKHMNYISQTPRNNPMHLDDGFPKMPRINQKHSDFLNEMKHKQQSYSSVRSALTSIHSPPDSSPGKYRKTQDFDKMSMHQRVQTAREYQSILEKEPLFISKNRLKLVSSEQMFRDGSPSDQDKMLQLQSIESNKFIQKLKTQNMLSQRDIISSGQLTSRNNHKSSKFSNTLIKNNGFSTIWRDSSLDQASREKIIAKLREKKQQDYLTKQSQRSLKRTEKASRILQLMQSLNVQKQDLSKNLNFSQMPMKHIQNELQDIAVLKQFLKAVVKVQALIRMIIQKRKFQKIKAYYQRQVRFLQGFFRARYMYKRFQKHFNEKRHKNILIIQKVVRGWLIRRKNLIEVKRLQKFKENLQFLDDLTRKQKEQERLEQLEQQRKQDQLLAQQKYLQRSQHHQQQQSQNYKKEKTQLSPQNPRKAAFQSSKRQLRGSSMIIPTATSGLKKRGETQQLTQSNSHENNNKAQQMQSQEDLAVTDNQESSINVNEALFSKEIKDDKAKDNLAIEKQNKSVDKIHKASIIVDDLSKKEDEKFTINVNNEEFQSQNNQDQQLNNQNLDPFNIDNQNHKIQQDDGILTIHDLEQNENQLIIPNYMKPTMSNICKELDLDDQKVFELKSRTKLTNNLATKQEIGEMIHLALENFQFSAGAQASSQTVRSAQRQSRQSSLFRNPRSISQQSHLNVPSSPDQMHNKDNKDKSHLKPLTSTSINQLNESFDEILEFVHNKPKDQVDQLLIRKETVQVEDAKKVENTELNENIVQNGANQKQQQELQQKELAIRNEQSKELEDSNKKSQLEEESDDDEDREVEEQGEDDNVKKLQSWFGYNHLIRKLNTIKEDKKQEKDLRKFVETENQEIQTSIIEEQKLPDKFIKHNPQMSSKEIQVELLKSKYNYLSISNQLKIPATNDVPLQSQLSLSRSQRKKELRQNLVYDKFIQHSDSRYDYDPYRFKCLQVHNQEPFICETPGDILAQTFFTPNELFFIVNHGPVPRLLEEEFSLYILGLVHRPLRLTLNELKTRFERINLSVTMKCAANRKREFDQVSFIDQGTQANNKFGNGAVGTAMWGGISLRDILKMAQIDMSKAKNIEFYGEDIVHNSDNANYAIALPIKYCLDKKSDILLAFEMNGETLSRDHGFPLRLICPGMIAAKSVKWLSRIMIIDSESPLHFQQKDFKLFPKSIDKQSVSTQWSNYPSITYLNVDCAFTNIEHNDLVPSDKRFVIKGYAISGQGNQITRVELTFDQGKTWLQCKLTNFKNKKAQQMDQSHKKWEWTNWEFVLENGLIGYDDQSEGREGAWVMVRAFDECSNTQPEMIDQIWNFKGYMNNSIQKIRLLPIKTKNKAIQENKQQTQREND